MKYAFGYSLLGVSIFFIVMNWLCFLATIKNKRNGVEKNHSMVLLVPEILIGLAALMPLPFNKSYLLIPLVLHIGTWFLPQSLFYLFREIFDGKRVQMSHLLTLRSSGSPTEPTELKR